MSVIEGLIVQVINRAAGSFLKDVDSSKLSASLWSGSVHLDKLELKENAFDRLKLPFRIRKGFAENVKIVVPITNLYKGTWEVEVGGLYITAGPVTGFRYDEATAAREDFEHKQAQLSKVEEAKKKAEAEKEGKQEEKGFFGGVVESLVAHIVKVVQIRVGNVHIQYEDEHSHPQHPFTCGITVEGLFLQSTDGQWKVGGRDSSDSLVFKLAELENLSVYWNTDASLTTALNQQEWEENMQRLVAQGTARPLGINYLFGPVSASARIMFNTKAGQVLSIPQVKVELGVEKVDISLDKLQFDGILSLLDSLDRMSTQKKFLQYRPHSSLKQLQGKDKLEWFRYAVNSVRCLIHRRRLVWSWSYIKQVRNDAKSYQDKYKKKLLTAKPSAQLLEELKELERRMSVFNITIARTQAESEVERSRILEAQKRSTSWASSWLGWAWSSSDTPKEAATEPHMPTDSEIEAEKDKLYASIGYSEGAVKGKFPDEYVAYRFDFSLEQIAVHLHDDSKELLSLAVQKTAVKFEGRPSAGGIKIDATVDSLNAHGCFHGDDLSQALVSTSETAMEEKEPLLSLTFELNPFDPEQEVKVDQRIILDLLPVQMVYDADTVDGVIKMFKMPPHVQLHRLSALALSKLADIQTQTRAGLEHALNVRKVLDIRVNLAAPYLVVPFGGKLSNAADVLVVDLGSLTIRSDWSHLLASEREIREATSDELEESFYDHFYLKLKDTQILMTSKDDNWETVRRSMAESSVHLLPPVLLNLTLKKSLVFNDPQRPNIIVSADLPELKLLLSEDKVVRTVKLLRSLPLPPPSLKRDQSMSSDTAVEYSEVMDDVLKELTEGEPDDETASDLAAKALVAQGRHASASVSAVTLDEGSGEEDSSDDYLTASECSSLYDDAKGESEFTPPLLTGVAASPGKLSRDMDDTDDEDELSLQSMEGDMDQSPEQLAAIVQVKVDLSVDKAVLQFAVSGSHGNESPRLSVEVLSLHASVCKRTFELNVTVSTGKASVVDHFVQDLQHNTLLCSEQERMLTVQYVQVDKGHPGFSSQMHSTLKSIDADVSHITVQVVRESLADLLCVAKRLGEAVSSPHVDTSQLEGTLSTVVRSASRLTTEDQGSKAPQPEGDSTVLDLRVNAHFGGLGLSLRNDGCEIMLAQVQDLVCQVALSQKMMQVTASLRDLYVADRTSSALFEDIIRKVNPEDTFVTVEFTMFKYPDDQAKYETISSPDIAINVALKQLRAIVRFRFLKALQMFVTQLVVDRRMLDSAKEAASTAAVRTAKAIQEAGEAESHESTAARIQLDIALQAPLIAVLLEEGSKAALVGDLGHLIIKNSFQAVKDGHGGEVTSKTGIPAVVDVMEVVIESVKLSRTKRFDLESSSLSEEFVICRPSEFHGRIHRNLSPWHQDVPSLEVFAEMGNVAVCVSPEDVRAVKMLVDSAMTELGLQAARTEDGEEEMGEAVGENVEHKTEEKHLSSSSTSQGSTTVVVHVDVQSASLTLQSELTCIAEVALNGLHSDVNLGQGVTKVTASLQGAKVLDLLGDPRYQTIAAFTDTSADRKALNLQLLLFSNGTEGEKQQDMSKCDIAVSGRMSGVKVVFVNLFVKRIQDIGQKLTSALSDRTREVSVEQATKAVEDLQQSSSSSKRISISLLLGIPVIQLPLSSKSEESFLLQLDQLRVQNSFHVIGQHAPGTDPLPVYDQMDVKLENISLYRQLQAKDTEEVAQRCLLKPVTMTAVVKRNLSPWYNGNELASKVDVDLQIGETQLGVADDDVIKVLELLDGNLSETLVQQEEKKKHHQLEGPATDSVFNEEDEEEENEEEEEGKDGEEEEEEDEQPDGSTETEEPQTGGSQGIQVRVSTKVAGLSLTVHRSGGDMVFNDQSSWEHNSERQLASFSLQHIDVLLEMVNSAEMKAHLSLSNCVMTDLRANRCSSVAEIIQKCPKAINQPLLTVHYDRSQPSPRQTAQRIDIVMQSMQVLLDMEFLFSVKDFADEILSSRDNIAKHAPTKGDTLTSKKSRRTVKPTVTDTSSQIHVEFKVQHPYIALLAKTGSGNEDALLLKGDIGGLFSMRKEGGSHDNQGTIRLLAVLTDMSMYGTTIAQLESPLQSQRILHPCSFTLSYSAPSSTGKDLLILLESTGSIDFVLSPADIRVLLGVMQATQRPKLDSASGVFDSPSDLGVLNCIDDTKWYLVKEKKEPSLMEKVEEAVQRTGLVPSAKIKCEQVEVDVPKITLTLEHKFDGGNHSPAFKLLATYLSSRVENWSSDIRGSASLSLQAAFFNKRFDVWEYLVEPLEQENREFKFWTMTAEINPLQAQQDMEGNTLAPKTLVSVSADEALQLTLTRSSIGRILSLVDEYTSPVQSQVATAKTQSQKEESRPLIVIKNRLGERFPVTIKPMEKLQHVDGSSQVQLKNKTEERFVSTAASSEEPSGGLLKQVAQRLVLEVTVPAFNKTVVVISGCNTTYYPLKPVQSNIRQPYGFVVEVESVSSHSTLVTIRSPVQVVNQLEEPCLVAMAAGHRFTSEEINRAISLEAGEKFCLPLDLAHTGHVFVKLKNKSVEFSDSYVKWNKSEKETLRCPKTGREVNDHYIRVSIVEEVYTRGTTLMEMSERAHHIFAIHYPIVIQNYLPHKVQVASKCLPTVTINRGQSSYITTCALTSESHIFPPISRTPKLDFTMTVHMDGAEWQGKMTVEGREDKADHFAVQHDKTEKTLAVHKEDRGSWRLSVYAPYWIINKTHLTLEYLVPSSLPYHWSSEDHVVAQREEDPDEGEPSIALLKLSSDLFKSSTNLQVRVQVDKSEDKKCPWSKDFSLDTVGYAGVIKIEHRGTAYHFGVMVQLSSHQLTKIITLSPFFLLENQTKHIVNYFEPAVDKDACSPHVLKPKAVVPFHPATSSTSLQISLDQQEQVSMPFNFMQPGSLLVRTKGKVSAVCVNVKATDHATLVSFVPYFVGSAPFLIVNNTRGLTFKVEQMRDSDTSIPRHVHTILPGHSYLYTWDNHLGKKTLLCWFMGPEGKEMRKFTVKPQDANGKFRLPKSYKTWLSLMNTTETMMMVGGSRRSGSTTPTHGSRASYGSESELSESGSETPSVGAEEVDGTASEADQWFQYAGPGDSTGPEDDSDVEGTEETDSGSTTQPKRATSASQRIKKFFRLGRSEQDKESTYARMKGRWVSFMDNIQRVLLLTLHKDEVRKALRGQSVERPHLECSLSLRFAGLSLVDDVRGQEVAYIGLMPCPVVWEWEKRPGYWRVLKMDEEARLEKAFQDYSAALDKAQAGTEQIDKLRSQTIDLQGAEWTVQFEAPIQMTSLKQGEIHRLRRSAFPGVFFKYTYSPSQTTVRARVFNVQVDNQLPNAMFPQVLYSIPPPPSIASSLEPKPLVEASVIMRNAQDSQAKEFKLIQVLLQKIGVEIELGFILAITRLLSGRKKKSTESEDLESDLVQLKQPVHELLLPALAAAQKAYFDTIHLSPVHIILSLSLAQTLSSKEEMQEDSMSVFSGLDPLSNIKSILQSMGTFIVDVKQAELKLNYFDASQVVLTSPELVQLVKQHYTQQVLLQIYKVVFNLNVIGNPVGLLGGLASGVTDLFYEPFQGIMVGPEEFVEALGIGIHSAVGGTVGGALGVFGALTGKLGDAAALVSMAEGEREHRRVEQRQGHLGYGVGGLLKGFGGAITNIVIQPVKGARAEGVVGFLKGAGRGVLGIVLRPVGGVLDLTSIAVDKLRKVTKIDDYEIVQIRLPRHIAADHIVRPYSHFTASGKAFFMELEPSASRDLYYITHFPLKVDPVSAFMVTNKYAVLFSQSGILDILKKWDRDETVDYDKMNQLAVTDGNALKVKVKKDFAALFSKKEETIQVVFTSPAQSKEAEAALNKAYDNFVFMKSLM